MGAGFLVPPDARTGAFSFAALANHRFCVSRAGHRQRRQLRHRRRQTASRLVPHVLAIALEILAFTGLYVIVPNRPMIMRDGLIGRLLAVLLLEVLKRVFAL